VISRFKHKVSSLLIAALLAASLPATYARAEEEQIDESAKYKLQAVFLYNFISGVEWPKIAYSGSTKIVDLCIIGKDPFGSVLDSVAKKAAERGNLKINIKRGVGEGDIGGCNVAYINSGDAASIASKAASSAVLTVAESGGFYKSGGMIEFVIKGKNVRFNINNKTARANNVKINPQLLELASEVVN
jgi:hypothetical protein